MTKKEFIKLHSTLKINIEKTVEINPIPSATDPTQDIPVRMIEFNALGLPLNVKELKGVFSNIKVENFTSIEQRNNDKFDVYGEFQNSVKNVATKKGVSTNYVKPSKTKKNG